MKETGKCLVLIAFGALFGWGASTIWPFAPFEPTKKDWVDASAAIGTCAAVVVALWFGAQQQLIARRDALVRATFIAGKITPRLTRLISQVEALTAQLVFSDLEPTVPVLWYSPLRTAADLIRWEISTDDLIALAPLPRQTAIQLGRGVAITNDIATAIADAHTWIGRESEWDARATARDAWVSQLRVAWSLLSDAMTVCNEVSARKTATDAAMRRFMEGDR